MWSRFTFFRFSRPTHSPSTVSTSISDLAHALQTYQQSHNPAFNSSHQRFLHELDHILRFKQDHRTILTLDSTRIDQYPSDYSLSFTPSILTTSEDQSLEPTPLPWTDDSAILYWLIDFVAPLFCSLTDVVVSRYMFRGSLMRSHWSIDRIQPWIYDCVQRAIFTFTWRKMNLERADEELLRELACNGDIHRIRSLVGEKPQLNINSQNGMNGWWAKREREREGCSDCFHLQ